MTGEIELPETIDRTGIIRSRMQAASFSGDAPPARFQWMPAGVHTIGATYSGHVRGKSYEDFPVLLTVECEQGGASKVQASFDSLRAANKKAKPFGDFDHDRTKAALWPDGFEWQGDGDEPGIYVKGEWSDIGLTAVRGKAYRSWSPTFGTDADFQTCVERDGCLTFPSGTRGSQDNPARVTAVGFDVGTLTNDPAFREISPVRAKQSIAVEQTTGAQFMLEELLQQFSELIRAGDFPGHEFHGNQYGDAGSGDGASKTASNASGKAHEATKEASNRQGHRDAKAAHMKAAEAHEKSGNEDTAAYHHAMAAYHGSVASGKTRAVNYERTLSLIRGNRNQTTSGLTPQGANMTAEELAAQKAAEDQKAEKSANEIKAQKALIVEKENEIVRAKQSEKDAKDANDSLIKSVIDNAVANCQARAALPAKDVETHKEVIRARKLAVHDLGLALEHLQWLKSDPQIENLTVRATKGIEVGTSSMGDTIQGFIRAKAPINELCQKGKFTEALDLSRQAGLIYANDMKAKLNGADFLVRDLVRAATTTDANVGSLAGDLVLQRCVEYLKNFLPLISRITTDFRNEPIMFGQTAIARYLGDPTVLTYSTTTGWGADATVASGSTPSATDIPVAINNYKGVEIRFNSQQMSGTVRNLFAEQAEPSAYVLANTVNTALLALITAANYPTVGTAIALADFKLASFASFRKNLDTNKVSRMPNNRTVLMNTDYGNKLLEDSNWILASAFRSALNSEEDIISSGAMPQIFGMLPIDTQTMPNTGNLFGAAFGKSALAFAARIPSDYTTVFPDLPPTASVSIVTEPMTGLSMMMVRYLNHQLETANARVALMYGVAKGQPNALIRQVSA